MARRNDKRSRLVASASRLFHEQAVSNTTLANIAQLADVPLGNVYYYFKSKESIIVAVIESLRRFMQQQFDQLNTINDPKARLSALLKQNLDNIDTTCNFGDALGGLCQELGKQGGKMSQYVAELMQEIVSWVEKQFIAIGKPNAKQLALNFIAIMQGMNLLTLTFKNKESADSHTNYLIEWINTV